MIKYFYCLILFFPCSVYSITCDMLSYNMDDSRTQLRRAINESDFESAKNYARRARSALDDASMSAMDCGCMELQFELDDASSRARRARDAFDYNDFASSINRAVRGFNSAIELMRTCRPKRR